MRAPDRYRQCWPDTVATIEKTPGTMATMARGALYVLQLATVAAVVYFLTVVLFSL